MVDGWDAVALMLAGVVLNGLAGAIYIGAHSAAARATG